jgi:hypothetical protein
MSDLFGIAVPSSTPDYIALRDDPSHVALKNLAQDLWHSFEAFADPEFRNQFALQIHPRFWEMYLGAWLVRAGFALLPRTSSAGPDFHLRREGRDIWIEAAAPDEGQGPDAVPSILEDRPNAAVPEDQIILRFTNAISLKKARRDAYVAAGMVADQDPFVIAINGRGIPMTLFEGPLPAIIRAVYPFGQYEVTIRVPSGETVREGYHRRTEIAKKSGSPVPTIAFIDPANSGLSGVLYSSAALWDYPRSPGSEFLYIHNSLAANPLRRGYFPSGKEWFLEGDALLMADHNAGA